MTNEPAVEWHHFLRSRFVGRRDVREGPAGMAVTVQVIEQQSDAHAELRGIAEYFSDPSLPIVCEFGAILQIETREISLQEMHAQQPSRAYEGRFSENGRVMTLRAILPGGGTGKPFHLVHEETLAGLSESGT